MAKSSSDIEPWPDYLGAASAGLHQLAVTTRDGAAVQTRDGFARWVAMTHDCHGRGCHLYFIGNGASAMMASHFAADACKNAGLSAMAFNDAALLTATANDVAFEEVFALPLRRIARGGDLLIAISSSGNSPNIVRAVAAAREMSLTVVTLTGMAASNPVRTQGELNFHVPLSRYGWVECAHQLVLHYWLDQYLNIHGEGAI